MQFARSEGVKPSQSWWHEGRQRAREEAFNSDLESFFSDTEITRLDLETAQIDGSDNVLTWTWDRPLDKFGMNGLDVRTLEDR
jgi:hypothetical protein